MLRIAYSRSSLPTAEKLREIANGSVELVRFTQPQVDVNWGRYRANAQLNPDISNVTNKRVMREKFREHGVPMPTLYDLDYSKLSEMPLPLIGRPDKHARKKGFWRINTYGQLLEAIRGRGRKAAATHFMEVVDAEREYRVHIFKGKSIRISRKEFEDDGSNKYTTAKPGEIRLRNVREAAKSAVAAVGLDFGAVDVLASGEANEQVWVLEVNAAPGLGGSMPQLYLDTFNKWKNGEWEDESDR